jgi:hypothetical protein
VLRDLLGRRDVAKAKEICGFIIPVKYFRCEVKAIWQDNCASLWIDPNPSEVRRVVQWLDPRASRDARSVLNV